MNINSCACGKSEIDIRFLWLDAEKNNDLPVPAYHSHQASGMDVAAAVEQPLQIEPGKIELIPTGFAVALPQGFELQVRPRSGLAIKRGITVVNSPGTIDADYRGEIMIGLINLGSEFFTIRRGDRIAQLVLAPVSRAALNVVASLDVTGRQDGGFGHTGV